MPIPKTALEYFKIEKNKQTKPHQRFYDEAIAALEKQIPRKAVTNVVIYHCPNCNNVLADMFKHSFCDRCGQALDWSDSE